MIFKKDVSERSAEAQTRSRAGGLSMLAQGCKFHGKILLHGDARIGGEVNGSVISSGVLTIEQSAVIHGDINGTHVLLNGRVDGNVFATEILRLSPSCVVTGDLCAKRLIVEDGATIDGRVTKLEKGLSGKDGTPSLSGAVGSSAGAVAASVATAARATAVSESKQSAVPVQKPIPQV